MKFQGTALKSLATGSVKLPRPDGSFLEFKIRATSLGDEDKGERLFPNIRPPMDFALDKKGMPLRDPRSDAILPKEPNFFDPGYMTKAEEHSRMQMVVRVVDALAEDTAVEWVTSAEHGTREFYQACYEEMRDAGITLGDMLIITKEARKLGNLDAKALEKAAESFSQKGA